MMILVRATRTGYMDHKRQREGAELMIDEKVLYKFDKQGKRIVDEETGLDKLAISWVEVLEEQPKPNRKIAVQGKLGGIKSPVPNPEPTHHQNQNVI